MFFETRYVPAVPLKLRIAPLIGSNKPIAFTQQKRKRLLGLHRSGFSSEGISNRYIFTGLHQPPALCAK